MSTSSRANVCEKSAKKNKCGCCSRKIPTVRQKNYCDNCNTFVHVKCTNFINLNRFFYERIGHWYCPKCVSTETFRGLTDDDLLATINYLNIENLTTNMTFTLQSLLSDIPGDKNDDDSASINDIKSEYYSPAKFVATKFPTTLHINIASLSAHIDDLKSLLVTLNHGFDIIGITETIIYDNHRNNIDITGYDFLHTPTKSLHGGAALYIKSDIDYMVSGLI